MSCEQSGANQRCEVKWSANLNHVSLLATNEHRAFETTGGPSQETLMYRTVNIAIITLAALTLLAGKSLAFSHGGGGTGHVGPTMAGVAPSVSRIPPTPGRGATPYVKKLSPKAGAACFRSCMHGVSGAGWGNFCDAACFGG
jgi:hypothetical protein